MYHLVFTGVFNFLLGKFELAQALFYSCLSLPNFLGQVINFYKSYCVVLIDSYFNPYKLFHLLLHTNKLSKMHDQNKNLENFLATLKYYNLQ
jgi:hypothetical protein